MLLALLLMIVCGALAPQSALAHASLLAAEPPDGATLQRGPDRIILHYSEPVSPLILRLIGPSGATTDLEHVEVRHQAVEITPPENLPNGTYALSWRVVSADGHPISGSLVFSIGIPAQARPTVALQTSRAVQVALWSARVLMYAGVFAGVGGAFFAAWITDRGKIWGSARRGIVMFLWVGVLATALSLGLQGLDTLALPLNALMSRVSWLHGLETSFGLTAAMAILGLIGGLLALVVKSRGHARILSGAALIAISIAFAMSGHASTAEPRWLMRTSVFLHVSGLAFWIGALMPLFAMLRSADPQSAAVMNRFSATILPVVVLLLIAGVLLAVVQVGSFSALWTTAYGVILLFKLAAVGALLTLATVNRLIFTPALARNEAQRRTWFAWSIAAEGLLVLLILGLVAGWRFTPPPRTIAAPPAGPPITGLATVSAHIHSEQGMAQIALSPGRVGRTTMTIRLASATGSLLNPKEVQVALSQPSSGIEPLERPAAQVAPGTWRVSDLMLPRSGEWQVQVEVLVSDFDKVILEGTITVRP